MSPNVKKFLSWTGGVLSVTASVLVALYVKEAIDKKFGKFGGIASTATAVTVTPPVTK